MNIHYVYAYLRQHDSKTAKAGTPYYIGKGKNYRVYRKHCVPIPEKKNIIFYKKNISNYEACKLEKELIQFYGRVGVDANGILLNKTSGGDDNEGTANPMYGRKHSEKTLENFRKTRRGRPNNKLKELLKDGRMRGVGNPMYGRKHKQNTLELMREKAKINNAGSGNPMYGKTQSEETRNKIAESHRGKKASEETKEKLRNKPRYDCVHCGLSCTLANLNRWHNDNCKSVS